MSNFQKSRLIAVVAIFSLIIAGCGSSTSSIPAPAPPQPAPQPQPPAPPPPPPPPQASLENNIKHIVFMIQENRSFDQYFGKLGDYRVTLGLPAEIDGIPPQGFTNPAAACTGPNDSTCGVVASFHQTDACLENTSPSWNEHHVDYNRWDAKNPNAPAMMDGYVKTAAGYSQANSKSDILGVRAMGYYTEEELNYYYFLAATFATSDRWFSPVPARSPSNRYYGFAATSEGVAYGLGEFGGPTSLKAKTIFQLLDEAGITWKVYHVPKSSEPLAPDPATYFLDYTWGQQHQDGHWVLLDEYFNDLTNGTLPQVALVESASGLDEHPGEGNLLVGQKHVAGIINALMQSSAWPESVFILTYDEMGGLFDHVPPVSTMNPDGIKPFLNPGDPTTGVPPDVPGDFTRTGMRIPLIVISPWVKKNFVSHTPADFTAILKFIETKFKLPSLTPRDAAQPDMTEFLDFSTGTPAYGTPPAPPTPRDPGSIKCTFVKPKTPAPPPPPAGP